MKEVTPPVSKIWTGHGKVPVALIRTGWDKGEGFYVGIKGGTASANHAHMDAGSFVFEAQGVRWAQDLGMQEYYSLERKAYDCGTVIRTGNVGMSSAIITLCIVR